MARSGKKVMQFLRERHYVANGRRDGDTLRRARIKNFTTRGSIVLLSLLSTELTQVTHEHNNGAAHYSTQFITDHEHTIS